MRKRGDYNSERYSYQENQDYQNSESYEYKNRNVKISNTAIFLFIFINMFLIIFTIAMGFFVIDSGFKWDRLESQKDDFDRLKQTLGLYQNINERGKPNGYAPLNSLTKIPREFFSILLQNAVNFLDCWNANTNSPTLMSSVGETNDQYVVCVPGSTILNGISNWNPFDLLLYFDDLFAWVKTQGSENEMISQSPLTSNEKELYLVNKGPRMTMKKLKGGQFINVNKSEDGTIIVNSTIGLENDLFMENVSPLVPGSGTFIEDGIGPDFVVKNILTDGGEQDDLNDTIKLNFPRGYGVESGVAPNIGIISPDNIFSFGASGFSPLFFNRVGTVLYLSQNVFIGSAPGDQLVSVFIDYDLKLSGEKALNKFDFISLASGYIGGYTFLSSIIPLGSYTSGYCNPLGNTSIRCTARTLNAGFDDIIIFNIFMVVKLE